MSGENVETLKSKEAVLSACDRIRAFVDIIENTVSTCEVDKKDLLSMDITLHSVIRIDCSKILEKCVDAIARQKGVSSSDVKAQMLEQYLKLVTYWHWHRRMEPNQHQVVIDAERVLAKPEKLDDYDENYK